MDRFPIGQMVGRVARRRAGLDGGAPDPDRTVVLPPATTNGGLPRRTDRSTVPDMFGRHPSQPDREQAAVTQAFHDRLAGATMDRRTDPPRIDARNLRRRLGGSPRIGLLARVQPRYVAG